ncbi:PAS domain-containing sensor histidine kinase [Halovivax gelatinilyticus]|uniref:PAS domain-containing sensor histidine kinase n=1 Tax=Halovivax gelatinilyticus TaxID=2961597 RepID=UPI0020CA64BA|nr:PAS domain S-box protein [Halovivax gelatinilyticus]
MTEEDGFSNSPVPEGETETATHHASLVNAVDDGIYRLDDEGRFVAVNDAIVETAGWTREELLGEHVSIAIEDDDARRLEREIRARLESGEDPNTTFSLAIETAWGTSLPSELRFSLLVDDGSFEGTVGVVRTVEDQDRSEHLPSIWETYDSISSVIDEADVGVFVLDDSFDVVWIDETTEEYFGIDSNDVIGRDKRTVIEGTIRDRMADPETFEETVLATYDDNTYVEQFECLMTAGADRRERWLEHRSKPIESGRYAGGRVELYYDITDRKESERARLESERRLRREYELTEQILDTSPVGIAVVHRDGSIVRANEHIGALLDPAVPEDGEPTETLPAMYDLDGEILPPDRRPIARALETGEPISGQEIFVEDGDGEQRWLSINVTPIGDERPPERVVAAVTEITDVKELAERRRRALEEREKELMGLQLATNLLETVDQPVESLLSEFVSILPQFFHNPDRTVARVSVGDHTATTRDDARYPAADRTDDSDPRILATSRTVDDAPIRIEISLVGETSAAETAEDAFMDEERELIEMLATLLKLHFDRRGYIDDLQESNERLEQFAYAASHDLQEPLRMVSSYLSLLERRYADELDDDAQEFIEYAVDGADRMRDMIEGLLAYSRVETRGEPMAPIDLGCVLNDVLDDLQLQVEETEASVEVDPMPRVEGDPAQLRQVFQNVLENAIEYHGDDSPRIDVTATRLDDRWRISIHDEGIGIRPDDHDRVFRVFQRLHSHEEHAGTGIGLALTRRIVERHGGEIWVDSEPGEGSTFHLTLPPVQE